MKLEIPNFDGARVLVVGDVMLDRYWSGGASRLSPEAPVPIVHIQDCVERPGGAGNVALNLAALGCQVTLLGFCGEDAAADTLESRLRVANINCRLERTPGAQTVTKLRVLSQHQQLIRLDFEAHYHAYDTYPLMAAYLEALQSADVVILSDYAKGTLRDALDFIAEANKTGIPVLVDPKHKDFRAYHGATLVTPNLKEFEAVVGVCSSEDELVEKGLSLIDYHAFSALLVTRGEHGMSLIQPGQPPLHLPANQHEVYDVTGAGDTVIAMLAACFAVSGDLSVATTLANIAAGISVSKLGAATVSVPELRQTLWRHHADVARGILKEDQLKLIVGDAKAGGERIIMTSGCFDILHAGHIAYLESAKALGDRLIVAVNDDASVARLKGPSRPINTVSNRMAVLAGLSSIDWVVSFSEQTPERIISHLQPDVWVKGGDYQIQDLPEAACVSAYGGEIKILQFIENCSTTAIIDRIYDRKKNENEDVVT